MINYRSVATLNKDIFAWLQKLPKNIDIIVGIPRSGLLAANLLSLYMNKPLTDVDGLLQGRVMHTGVRFDGEAKELLSDPRRVLVVDDSVHSGTQMREVKRTIEAAKLPHEIFYAAVYVKPGSQNVVDHFYQLLPVGRLFEWNVFHKGEMDLFCVDIDGVLCRDPTEDENDDGKMYEHFIQYVEPWVVPTKTIGWLVTCRLEKYRAITQEWLARHGIKYQHLIMMNLPDKETRLRSGSHARYKAEVYKNSGARLFIESSDRQSKEIARLSGKPVYCVESREMINPRFLRMNYHRWRRFLKLLCQNPAEGLRIVKRRLYPT
jgi:orotate phosphoribosyltransferase